MSQEKSKQTDKQLLINQSAAQLILDYLAKRPFHEVHLLAPSLMNLKEGTEVVVQQKPEQENNTQN